MSLPLEIIVPLGATMAGRDLTPPKDDLTTIPRAEAMARVLRLHEAAGHLAEHAPQF